MQQIELKGRRFRCLSIADRWQKSKFEYWNEKRQEWRETINWDSKERLFEIFKSERNI